MAKAAPSLETQTLVERLYLHESPDKAMRSGEIDCYNAGAVAAIGREVDRVYEAVRQIGNADGFLSRVFNPDLPFTDPMEKVDAGIMGSKLNFIGMDDGTSRQPHEHRGYAAEYALKHLTQQLRQYVCVDLSEEESELPFQTQMDIISRKLHARGTERILGAQEPVNFWAKRRDWREEFRPAAIEATISEYRGSGVAAVMRNLDSVVGKAA